MLNPIEYTTLADLGVAGSESAMVALVEQGQQQWFSLRAGKITASNAANIVTATGKTAKGKTRDSYLYGLLAERVTGSIEVHQGTLAMVRGQELEPRARDHYRFTTGREVHEVGLVFADADKRYAASPDGLCADRGLEVKSPLRKGSIAHVLNITRTGKVPIDYFAQLQFSMYVTGIALWDLLIYSPEPGIPSIIITAEPCDKYFAALDEVLPEVLAELDANEKVLREAAE